MSDFDFDKLIAEYNKAKADKEAAIQEQIDERKNRQQENKTKAPYTIDIADIPEEEIKWLMYPYLQINRLTLLAGDPGLGKSYFAMAIAAAVSSGNALGKAIVSEPGHVVIASSEDDDSVVAARLKACGCEPRKCHLIRNTSSLTLKSQELEDLIAQHDARLLIIDPLHKYYGSKADFYKANETGEMLDHLTEMLERNNCACLAIEHLTKGSADYSPVLKVLGSVDVAGSARSVWLVTRDPEAQDKRNANNLVFHVKSNNAPAGLTMAYTIDSKGAVDITGLTSMTYEEAAAIVRSQKYADRSSNVDYEKSPIRHLFNKLAAEHPGGAKWRYSELDTEAIRILGKKPWQNTNHCKQMIKEYQSKMAEIDKVLVEVGVHLGQNRSGVRMTIVGVPNAYQSEMELKN